MRKIICGTVTMLCFFGFFGLVGSYELGKITVAGFVAQGIPMCIVAAASILIGGFNR